MSDKMNENENFSRRDFFKSAAVVAGAGLLGSAQKVSAAVDDKIPVEYLYNDSHVHLTDYVQEGTDIRDFLKIMDGKVGRSLLFGLPLQQKWSYLNSGDDKPTYYLDSDAKMYYYSFNDAMMAHEYNKLNTKEKKRFDPMITGFNPNDMYAVEHIKRVLTMYPDTFVGLGEFSIHKEFVSSKIAGETATLNNKALDRVFDFAAESGLAVLFHNDIDVPFNQKPGLPVYAKQMHELIKRHPGATVIWAHTGLGRVVEPHRYNDSDHEKGHHHVKGDRNPNHIELLTRALEDPKLPNLYYDISWDQVAKYILATPESLQRTADLINKYPDRFLFGTDHVAPDPESYYSVYEMYAPLWKKLTPKASKMVRLTNYERIFNTAKTKVMAWEKKNRKK